MQKLLDKIAPNREPEEQWVELIALSGIFALALFMAAAGFMLGPLFTSQLNDLEHPGAAHYSVEGAGIGAVIGLVLGSVLWFVRRRMMKSEAAESSEHEQADH